MDVEQQHSNPQPSMQTQMQQQHSMQPVGQHPYSNGHHTPDYRASPTQQHNNALSHTPHLPPVHHFEGNTMQSQQQQYAPAPMNGAQMQHPPPYNPHQFQFQNGAMQPPPMPSNLAMSVNGQNGMMRYPIPPQGPLPMGQVRAAKNKEVKRRTKTGCLTCRKRRIKCDEAQPGCRNCAKSKRECMGYDPIFKQQTGPAPIQPAPASATTPTQKSTSTPTSATLPPHVYPQQQTFPGTGGTFVAAGGNFVSPTQSHTTDPSFEYGPSLDPALAGGDAALTMAANSYSSTLQPTRQVRYVSIDQLFSLNDVPPQYQHREAPPPGAMPPQREIDEYYKYHYGPGLDRMFETTWYTSRGLNRLQHDPSLLDFTAQCMQRMTSQADDPASVDVCRSLEARLVWKLACMPRTPSHSHSLNGMPTDPLTLDLLPRIDTIEALITGQFLPPPQIPTPPSPQSHADRETQNRQSFWHHLGRFASIRDDTPGAHHDISDTLATLRGILSGMENRDVLYSIAIGRHVGGRLLEFQPPNRVQASTDDPNDEVKKLQVACDFVAAEDQRGTTQVIQRICGMAIRGWMLQRQ